VFFIPTYKAHGNLSNVVAVSKTATDDLKFRLFLTELWFREANIHCVTNDCKYGDTNTQDATITAGDIISFQDFNAADLFFINAAAGSNTTIYFVGVLHEVFK